MKISASTLAALMVCVALAGCEGGNTKTASSAAVEAQPNAPANGMGEPGAFGKNASDSALAAGALPGAVSFDGTVNAIATAANGTLYLGGSFTRASPTTGSAALLDAATGQLAATNLPIVVGEVFATAPDGAGGWYLGGTFAEVGGIQRNNIAHVLANGAVDATFNPNANAGVYALAVAGGVLYVGGNFTALGGTSRQHLAALDTNGALLPWHPNANAAVSSLLVSGNTIYVGGDFASIDANTRMHLAAIDVGGTLLPWNPGVDGPVGASVAALAQAGNIVYAGGNFTVAGGGARNNLAAFDTSGALLPWNPAADAGVRAVAVANDTVYVGGFFNAVGTATRNHLAAISTSGVVLSWNANTNGNVVWGLATAGSTVYAAGDFTTAAGTARNRLAAIDADGTLLPWDPDAHDYVRTLAISGNTLCVGGKFTGVGGEPRSRLAAIGADGALLPWHPAANGLVNAIAISGSTVYAGGAFTAIDGVTRNRAAAIDAGGSLLPWDPNANSSVLALAVAGSTVYLGGAFSTIHGVPRGRLAAFDSSGQLLPWNPDADSSVVALAISGNTVYAGGLFTAIGGISRTRLAAIDAGGPLLPWSPVANSLVSALSISGSTLYAGGAFTAINSVSRSRLAAIDASGALLPWNPAANNLVNAIAVSGKAIYVGGDFTAVATQPRNRIAAIGTDGFLLSFNPDANGTVRALAVAGPSLHAGGSFTSLGGAPRGRFGTLGASYTVGGTITGLSSGTTVILKNNGVDTLPASANGPFVFTMPTAIGQSYEVTVGSQPANQICSVANGSGFVTSSNVTNIAVTCGNLPAVQPQAAANGHSVELSWTIPAGAIGFNIYVSSARNCDIKNYTSCPDGALLMNVSSPYRVTGLRNRQAYFFRIESVFASGSSLSDEIDARPSALVFTDSSDSPDVRAIAAAADGTVYVGGQFSGIGLDTGVAAPLDVGSGQLKSADFPIVRGEVFAVAADGVGGWYLGGAFSEAAGEPHANLVHVLANGTVDAKFNQAPNQAVYALAVNAGTLYLGGEFTAVGTQGRNHLAAFDAQGKLLPWSPNADSAVYSFTIAGKGLYAGGTFTHVGGAPISHLVAFDLSLGGSRRLWNPAVTGGGVWALASSGTLVYAGGDFTSAAGQTRLRLAAFNTFDSPSDPEQLVPLWDTPVNDTVLALAFANGTLYLGGEFSAVDGVARSHLAALDSSAVLKAWQPETNGLVAALVASGNTVYAGGKFTSVKTSAPGDPPPVAETRNRLAAIDIDGRLYDWRPNANARVGALALSGSTLYVGGAFSTVATNTPRKFLAALDAGGALLPWQPQASNAVKVLAVEGSTIYAGGSFTSINGTSRTYFAALDPGGQVLPWNASGLTDPVTALVLANNRVYLGGSHYLVAYNATDGGKLDWTPAIDGTVNALATDGTLLYLGGTFATVAGASRQKLAAFDTVADPAQPVLSPWQVQANDTVRALAFSSSSALTYAGGLFTTLNGLPRSRFGALTANAGLPEPSVQPDGNVVALAVSGDTLYIGGPFAHFGTAPRGQLAAISASGALLPWSPVVSGFVSALTVSGDTVYVGGVINELGGVPRVAFGAVSAFGAGEVVQ